MVQKRTMQILKALSNTKRLEILLLLKDNEQSVGALEQKINLSQSALSQHLALLRKAGIVKTRRQAQKIFYRLEDEQVKKLLDVL